MSDKAKLKRYNGSAFTEVYPLTTHDQIVASGTRSSSTFLRGDGVWATPSAGVTSVGGTGTVSGITLSGTVTSTGNLTLGGTFSAPISSINDSTSSGQSVVKMANPASAGDYFLRLTRDGSSLFTTVFRTPAETRTDIGANNATNLTTGTVATARLGTGTANSTTFLRGDNTWATPTGGTGTVTSVSAGTQLSGMGMTITNATTTPSIATSVTNAANFRTSIGANSATNLTTGTLPTARIPVPLVLSNGAGSATIQSNNSFSTTLGLASIQGTSTAGNVYLSTFRTILDSNRRAAIHAEVGSNTSDNATKYAGFFNGRVTVVNNTTTISANTTLSEIHAGVTVFCTNSTAITITVPADGSNLAFPPGTEITFIRRGAGTVTVATTNISLFSVGSGTANAGRRAIANQNEGVILIKDTGNTWQLIGAL
jgi:hypothetical protein